MCRCGARKKRQKKGRCKIVLSLLRDHWHWANGKTITKLACANILFDTRRTWRIGACVFKCERVPCRMFFDCHSNLECKHWWILRNSPQFGSLVLKGCTLKGCTLKRWSIFGLGKSTLLWFSLQQENINWNVINWGWGMGKEASNQTFAFQNIVGRLKGENKLVLIVRKS